MLDRSIVQGACISRRGLLRVFAATGCVTLAGCGDVDPGQPESPVLAVSYEPPVGQAVPAQVPLPLNVFSFAGGGNSEGVSGIGLASGVIFPDVGGLAGGPDGTAYIADSMANRVYRVRPDGVIEEFAGVGIRGHGGDGGEALKAVFSNPGRLLSDQNGSVFVAESERVRKISSRGIVSTILGDGQPGIHGDGGPSVYARTAGNAGMAIDGGGSLFVAERAAHRVRRIDPRGVVTTVAGNGRAVSGGDGGQAVDASLNQPVDLDIDTEGNLLIAELGGNRIRRVLVDGVIETVVGIGVAGSGGDGGPARKAELNGPQGVAVDSSGAIFVADWNNRRIRRVSMEGSIETVAGGGGLECEGAPASQVRLDLPLDVVVTMDGRLLVVEDGSNRVRVLTPLVDGTLSGQLGCDPIPLGGPALPSGVAVAVTAVPTATATPTTRSTATEPATSPAVIDGVKEPTITQAFGEAVPATPGPTKPLRVISAVLALRMDKNSVPFDPTFDFHPGERVNLSVTYSNIPDGVRLGIRWFAGDSLQASAESGPEPAREEGTYGFWLMLPETAPVGPWKAELLDGSKVLLGIDFSVSQGEARSFQSPG